MKTKCEACGRMVGISKGKLSKHRNGRSTPTKVKMFCYNSGLDTKPAKATKTEAEKLATYMNRAARRAAMAKERLQKAKEDAKLAAAQAVAEQAIPAPIAAN